MELKNINYLLINFLIKKGKKNLSEKILKYIYFSILQKKKNPKYFFSLFKNTNLPIISLKKEKFKNKNITYLHYNTKIKSVKLWLNTLKKKKILNKNYKNIHLNKIKMNFKLYQQEYNKQIELNKNNIK